MRWLTVSNLSSFVAPSSFLDCSSNVGFPGSDQQATMDADDWDAPGLVFGGPEFPGGGGGGGGGGDDDDPSHDGGMTPLGRVLRSLD
jgi:hypothetical protein